VPSPLVGPSYNLRDRPASVQRSINLMPVPVEAGNERAGWTLKDVPGLRVFSVSVGVAQNIAWLDVITDNGTAATLGNNGTNNTLWTAGADWLVYVGMVGWTSETIVWSGSWAPATSDPSPSVAGIAGGKAEIIIPSFNFFRLVFGTYTISATIDGNPAAQQLEISIGPPSVVYQDIAWQEVP
jgi:hypothetical protein